MKMSIPLTLSTRKHKTPLAQPLKKPQQTESHIRKKGAQSNKTPRHKNHLIPERKSFHTYFKKNPTNFFWPPPPHYFSPATDRTTFTFTPISYVNSCNTTGSTFLYTLEGDKTTPPTVNKSRSTPTPNNRSFSSKYGLTNPQSLSVNSANRPPFN